MEELKALLPFIQILATIVMVVWSWAKLDKKVALLNQKLDEKITLLNQMFTKIDTLDEKLNRHLIDHK